MYYADKGTDNWYQAAFSIVDYGTRAVPNTYFQLALDQHRAVELLALEGPGVRRAVPADLARARRRPSAPTSTSRRRQILQDQVPMMNFLVNTAVAGQSADRRRRRSWRRTGAQSLFRDAHFTQ